VCQDIEAAGRAIKPAANGAASTSSRHLEDSSRVQAQQAQSEILRLAVESVKRARAFTDDVEFSPEDASRTELDFLVQIVEAAIAAGATTINMPDTTGYATPTEYEQMFRHVIERAKGAKNVIFSAHCHDDLGSRWPTRWPCRAGRARSKAPSTVSANARQWRSKTRHGDPHPRRCLPRPPHRLETPRNRENLAPRLAHVQLPRAAQQGHRRRERPPTAASTRTASSKARDLRIWIPAKSAGASPNFPSPNTADAPPSLPACAISDSK
jgi:hypothetical protein